MYPVLFEIFGFPISTFGVMLAIAFLTGTWLTALRMREIGLDPEQATTMLIYAMVGGIGGSKLYFAIDVSLREGIPFTQLLFAREGITFYGGLLGAIALVIVGTKIHKIPTGAFFNCVCLAGRHRTGARTHWLLPGRRRLWPPDGRAASASPSRKARRRPSTRCTRPSSTSRRGSSPSPLFSGRGATRARGCGPST